MHHNTKTTLLLIALCSIITLLGFVAITGGTPTGAGILNPACFGNEDCDDHISVTEDICKNPGTVYSLCTNQHQEP